MKCYQISQDGECVALVDDIAMVRAITGCQPQGSYVVKEVEVGPPILRRKLRARRPSTNQRRARARRKPNRRPSRWLHEPSIATVEQAQNQAR